MQQRQIAISKTEAGEVETRKAKPWEIMIQGTHGFYFVSHPEDIGNKYRKWWRYEYFGKFPYDVLTGTGYKNGIAKLRKTDLIKTLKERLNGNIPCH